MQNNLGIYVEEIIEGVTSNMTSKSALDLNSLFNSMLAKIANMLNLPSVETLKNIDWSDIKGALTTVGITLIVIFFSCIVMYILKSIGLYTMLKKEKAALAWLSFIPYGSLYAIGKAVGKTKIYGIEVTHTEYLLPVIVLSSALPFTCGVPFILFMLAMPSLLYKLYKKKAPSFALPIIILSVLFFPLVPLFLFAMRNK